MAELVNKTAQIGPYPGRTWKQEADKIKRALFPFLVLEKIDPNQCDNCMKPCSPEHSCCSKQCFLNMQAERKAEARAEARMS